MPGLGLALLLCAAAQAQVTAPSQRDPWLGQDKALHYAASAAIAAGGYGAASLLTEPLWQRALLGLAAGAGAGAAKELWDLGAGGDPSLRDLVWDGAGALSGVLLAIAVDLVLREGPEERSQGS